MSNKICNPEYLAKALLLKEEEKERLLSRMSGKLPRRLAKEKLSVDEALAIQLEIEDEQLSEWREKMHAIKAKEAAKGQKKKKAAAKVVADEPVVAFEDQAPALKPKATKSRETKPQPVTLKVVEPQAEKGVTEKKAAQPKSAKPVSKAAPKTTAKK